jgi:type III restriction enzyme
VFSGLRPFLCQVEAVKTVIWLTEVAPQTKPGKVILDHLVSASKDANPELIRLALKLATGGGKATPSPTLGEGQVTHAGSIN